MTTIGDIFATPAQVHQVMKKAKQTPVPVFEADTPVLDAGDMRPEYDFRGGVRGQHAKDLSKGYTTIVHHKEAPGRLPTTALCQTWCILLPTYGYISPTPSQSTLCYAGW